METKEQLARQYFLQGYNCAQSVLLAYAGECGLTPQTAALLASSLGGGMGRLREVCGALTSSFLALGALYGYSDPADGEAKAAHYARVQRLAGAFKEEFGSILCRDLLSLPAGPDSPIPRERTAGYYRERPCAAIVGGAARLLEEQRAWEKESCAEPPPVR